MVRDIVNTHDHEIAHAYIPFGLSDEVEENWVIRFERAGAWARR
jgi:hypothetical protein